MMTFSIGDKVTAIYKTGKYIGEITDIKPTVCVVRILAVLKHPVQGDLHNPRQTDVAFFHERKALAFREQANIPAKMVKPYEGEIPDYNESLKQTFDSLKFSLEKEETAFAAKSLDALNEIKREYELMYNLQF
ncbi:kinase-associated lipoprotein B [Falsibacillus albus]|uniref:Kinase n=1 Tax=Falsibacillus albus TaxID=2478915 RepID=A0A3L7K2D9_9BACI|nr:kinase-associated lipoprotein B [Falsibacillus albus]RLQ96499.1 kinase [Falsibacillus albus]